MPDLRRGRRRSRSRRARSNALLLLPFQHIHTHTLHLAGKRNVDDNVVSKHNPISLSLSLSGFEIYVRRPAYLSRERESERVERRGAGRHCRVSLWPRPAPINCANGKSTVRSSQPKMMYCGLSQARAGVKDARARTRRPARMVCSLFSATDDSFSLSSILFSFYFSLSFLFYYVQQPANIGHAIFLPDFLFSFQRINQLPSLKQRVRLMKL